MSSWSTACRHLNRCCAPTASRTGRKSIRPPAWQRSPASPTRSGRKRRLSCPTTHEGHSLPPSDLVANAHKLGLQVHLWAVAAENADLPLDYRRGDPSAPGYAAMHGDATGLARKLFEAGVDGIFTDYPDLVAAGRPARLRGLTNRPDSFLVVPRNPPRSGSCSVADEMGISPAGASSEMPFTDFRHLTPAHRALPAADGMPTTGD